MTTASSPSTSPGVAAAALRHVTSINDLTNDEIERIFVAADAWLATLGDPLVRHRIARSTDSAHGRILATLVRELDRRDARYSIETMCIGGGQGLAAVLERLPA